MKLLLVVGIDYICTGLQVIHKLFFCGFLHLDLHFVPQCTSKETVHTTWRVVRVAKKMNSKTKQHVCTEFCVWLKKASKKTIICYQRRLSQTNVWVIRALKSGIKNSKTIKGQFTIHHNVVGQELWRLKSTPTLWLPSLKAIDNCPLRIMASLSNMLKMSSELNTDAGAQNETCIFCVGSSFAHMRTNWT